MKLNIGSGKNRLDGYVSVDPFVDGPGILNNFAWQLPFDYGSVEEIYCSHSLEHIPHDKLFDTLEEFYRVLRINGNLIIICPDFEKVIKSWLKGDYFYRYGLGHDMIFGNQLHDGQHHYTGFTKKRLSDILYQFGFDVIEIKNQDNRHKRDRKAIPLGDIYVKAIKR
jgi:predicted SAM-dependent methyltransferase